MKLNPSEPEYVRKLGTEKTNGSLFSKGSKLDRPTQHTISIQSIVQPLTSLMENRPCERMSDFGAIGTGEYVFKTKLT